MGSRSREGNTGLHGEGRVVEREIMQKGGKRRAWEFERRLEEVRGSELASKCWEEMRLSL